MKVHEKAAARGEWGANKGELIFKESVSFDDVILQKQPPPFLAAPTSPDLEPTAARRVHGVESKLLITPELLSSCVPSNL